MTRPRTGPLRWRALAALATALSACGPRLAPCAGPTCGESLECLANRCVPTGTDPVDPESARLVLYPEQVAVVTREGAADPGLPVTVALGDAKTGEVTLLLTFGDGWKIAAHIDAAFLLLEPVPATRGGEDVDVSVWRVNDAWDPEHVEWSSQPTLGIPSASGIARSRPPAVLRVDVTRVVRFLQDQSADHGLALTAGAGRTGGASYWTGAGGGRGPRLELYVRGCEPGRDCPSAGSPDET